jgi:S1-C subfamily serine protease
VDELDPDSPALAAGIRPGDWIMGINGKAIGKWSFSQLRRFGETVEVGQHILVDIYRPSDRSDIHAEVVVARKPKAAPAPT